MAAHVQGQLLLVLRVRIVVAHLLGLGDAFVDLLHARHRVGHAGAVPLRNDHDRRQCRANDERAGDDGGPPRQARAHVDELEAGLQQPDGPVAAEAERGEGRLAERVQREAELFGERRVGKAGHIGNDGLCCRSGDGHGRNRDCGDSAEMRARTTGSNVCVRSKWLGDGEREKNWPAAYLVASAAAAATFRFIAEMLKFLAFARQLSGNLQCHSGN